MSITLINFFSLRLQQASQNIGSCSISLPQDLERFEFCFQEQWRMTRELWITPRDGLKHCYGNKRKTKSDVSNIPWILFGMQKRRFKCLWNVTISFCFFLLRMVFLSSVYTYYAFLSNCDILRLMLKCSFLQIVCFKTNQQMCKPIKVWSMK